MSGMDENLSFEAALGLLEDVVRALEAGELALDDAIERFQTGMRLVRLCREKLHAAEQKVELVMATETSVEARPFEVKE